VSRLGSRAERHLDQLITYYEAKDRPEATQNLLQAVERAAQRIDRSPGEGLLAPRPYPELAKPGRRWIKQGAYWIAYVQDEHGAIIIGIFHDSADIPNRI
jgi:plasmid stabilization system protein ParE